MDSVETPQPAKPRRFQVDLKTDQEFTAAKTIMHGVFTYDRVGYDMRAMTFHSDGQVGLGSGGRETFWDVRQIDDKIVLELSSETEATCRLIEENGIWKGRWLCAEKMPVELYRSVVVLPGERKAEAEDHTLPGRAVKAGIGGIFTREYEAQLYTQDRGDFTKVHDANVLIYFRHGLGDWATLSCILPLLDPSNRYWITRFGDDYTSIMEGSPYVTPIYLGSNTINCGDGNDYHNMHFGMDLDRADGSSRTINLPLSLHDLCTRKQIDTFLHISYPEIHGLSQFPFHSKARFMLPYLVKGENLNEETLKNPLKTAINFEVDPWITNWVQSRLRNYGGFGERKLCLISRNGYTAHGKNWGHRWREDMPQGKDREGEECRDFMRLLLKKDPQWMFLIMEDSLFQGDHTLRSEELHAYSFAEVFGEAGRSSFPFGILMKALLHFAELSVGVPTGPYHLSMVKPDLPTIGLWLEHLPCWYDEPKSNSLHLISRNLVELGLDRRPGSFTDVAGLHFPIHWLTTRIIPGERVFEAAEALIY